MEKMKVLIANNDSAESESSAHSANNLTAFFGAPDEISIDDEEANHVRVKPKERDFSFA